MIAWDIAGVRFSYRVAGVCLEDRHILANRITGMDYWFLPGGRVEVGESSEEALRREMQEELEIAVGVGRLLWLVENFFENGGQSFHEIGLYYETALPPGSPYSDKSTVYRRMTESGHEALFQWFPLDTLHSLNLVPPFLKERVHDLPHQTHHLVERR